MKIWIDADACPRVIKEIVFRASERLELPVMLVANQSLAKHDTRLIESVVVADGFDVADDYIAEHAAAGDLVITADIPLADRVIAKNAHAIDHRGELYSMDNIKQYLAMRNLMESIRESGETTKGPKPFSLKDAHEFANQLNAFLAKWFKN